MKVATGELKVIFQFSFSCRIGNLAVACIQNYLAPMPWQQFPLACGTTSLIIQLL